MAGVLGTTVLLGCGSLDLGDANIFSVQDEWRLGQQLAADIARDRPLVRDAEAQRLMQSLGEEVLLGGDLAQLPWGFHVVDSDEVNAFNIPGGHVYVNEGLVCAADDAAELMGVVSHEVAHGLERHATQQVTKAYGVSFLLDMALGREAGALEQLAANLAAGGTLAHYSREAEREADAVGVQLMAAAGYDPTGMADFFEKLIAMRQRQPNRVDRFFASHPVTETRIARVTQQVAELPNRRTTRHDERFDRLRQILCR